MPLRQSLFLWLTRLAAGASVPLTVALLTAWITSYLYGTSIKRSDWWLTATEDHWTERMIVLGSGRLAIARQSHSRPAFVGNFTSGDAPFSPNRVTPSGARWTLSKVDLPFSVTLQNRWWFVNWTIHTDYNWEFLIDLWAMNTVAALISIFLIMSSASASLPFRRVRAGLCPTCGYDVRATPRRCPECGGEIGALETRAG